MSEPLSTEMELLRTIALNILKYRRMQEEMFARFEVIFDREMSRKERKKLKPAWEAATDQLEAAERDVDEALDAWQRFDKRRRIAAKDD